MMQLPAISLPLPPNGPPSGYGWDDRDMSARSSTTAFQTGLDRRDRFLGEIRCVVCGEENTRAAHVIAQSEETTWTDLKRRHWVPSKAKDDPAHEPRNGLTLCHNHHYVFDQYQSFIRYVPESRMFVFINYSGRRGLNQYHGKAIAIDIDDLHAPFPSIFIIHEMRVRGYNPFQPIETNLPNEVTWQDWILSDDLLADDNNEELFKRDPPAAPTTTMATMGDNNDITRQQGTMTGTSSGTRKLELNAGVIADILAATHAMPSWKACQMENTSWSGTTDENIQRYVSLIGVEEPMLQNGLEHP